MYAPKPPRPLRGHPSTGGELVHLREVCEKHKRKRWSQIIPLRWRGGREADGVVKTESLQMSNIAYFF